MPIFSHLSIDVGDSEMARRFYGAAPAAPSPVCE